MKRPVYCSYFGFAIIKAVCRWNTSLLLRKSSSLKFTVRTFYTFHLHCLYQGSTAIVGPALLLIPEVSRSNSHIPHSAGLLWTSDRPIAETSTWKHTQHSQKRGLHASDGIRTCNPANERPQTHALGRAATGIGFQLHYINKTTYLHQTGGSQLGSRLNVGL
jgi:hypothetical protein